MINKLKSNINLMRNETAKKFYYSSVKYLTNEIVENNINNLNNTNLICPDNYIEELKLTPPHILYLLCEILNKNNIKTIAVIVKIESFDNLNNGYYFIDFREYKLYFYKRLKTKNRGIMGICFLINNLIVENSNDSRAFMNSILDVGRIIGMIEQLYDEYNVILNDLFNPFKLGEQFGINYNYLLPVQDIILKRRNK